MENYANLIKNLTTINPKTILEIGSLHGHDANTLKNFFNLSESDVWVVEPNHKQQIQILDDYPNFNLIKSPVFNKKEEHDFYLVDGYDAGTSSLFDRTDSWYELQGNGLQKIKLQTITGKELLKIINKPIELCKIDVEGLSYEVLESFEETIENIFSFHIESEHREVWKGQKLYHEVETYLKTKEYLQIFFKWVANGDLQSDTVWVHKKYLK